MDKTSLIEYARANDTTLFGAIEIAFTRSHPIGHYGTSVEDGAEDIDPDLAREIASEDPSLIYIEGV